MEKLVCVPRRSFRLSLWHAHVHLRSSGQIPGGEGFATIKSVRDRRNIT